MVDPDNRGEGAPPRHVHIEGAEDKKFNWLPWLLAALGLLLLLFTLSRCNNREERVVPVDNTVNEVAMDTNVVTEPVTSGAAVSGEVAPAGVAAAGAAATGDALGQMRTYLASQEAAGRRFSFDGINFATGSAALPAAASGTVSAIAAALQQHPNARVRVEGYADARGGEGTNAQLGAQRAQAVATALTAAGIDQGRIETATGGEKNPIDSNATGPGQAENRRTDLVVLSK